MRRTAANAAKLSKASGILAKLGASAWAVAFASVLFVEVEEAVPVGSPRFQRKDIDRSSRSFVPLVSRSYCYSNSSYSY